MIKKIKKCMVLLPLLVLVAACGNNTESFNVQGTYENMQGLWGAWNEDSAHFEFVEFLSDLMMHGYLSPDGDINFIVMGGYHFHGAIGHAVFNVELDTQGYLSDIWESIHFMVGLTENGQRIELDILGDGGRTVVFDYLGQELESLDEELEGAEFLGQQISSIVDSLWGFMVEAPDPHGHGHGH